MLKLKNITYKEKNITILNNLNLEVAKGSITTIIGSNGIGKSTLLNILAGKIIRGVSGEIFFKERNITKVKPEDRFSVGLFMLSENKGRLNELTVLENLKLIDKKVNWDEITSKIPLLNGKKDQISKTLSGGELQILAITKAYLSKKDIILIDEPTSGLSPKYIDIVYTLIKELNREQNSTIILVEQNPFIASKYSDKVLTIKEKSLVELSKDTNWENYYL